MPRTTLGGHPLHPELIPAPVGMLPLSLAMDLLHIATKRECYAEAAYYSMMGGYLGGLVAATAGGGDYLTIPPRSKLKRTANLHAILNLSLVGLYSVNLLLRKGKRPPTGVLPIALSIIGNTALVASAWYGGHMVYEYGMRVRGISPVEGAPELKPPFDDQVARTFETLTEKVTTDGSQARPQELQEQEEDRFFQEREVYG